MSKERDPATYEGVSRSSLLTPACQQAYWALWGAIDGLTRGQVAQVCAGKGWKESGKDTWSKAISLLVKMGVVEKGNKRHCPVTNKEEQAWEVSKQAAPIKPKANKPSAKMFERGVEQLEILLLSHQSKGDGLVTEDLQRLFEWVKDKVPTSK